MIAAYVYCMLDEIKQTHHAIQNPVGQGLKNKVWFSSHKHAQQQPNSSNTCKCNAIFILSWPGIVSAAMVLHPQTHPHCLPQLQLCAWPCSTYELGARLHY